MPYQAKKACITPGCPNVSTRGVCDQCKKKRMSEYDQGRGTAAQRGYNGRWRKARKHFLTRNPLCVVCDCKGIVEPATVVDHIRPHRGNKRLFWDAGNWQALCKKCHDEKTFGGE